MCWRASIYLVQQPHGLGALLCMPVPYIVYASLFYIALYIQQIASNHLVFHISSGLENCERI